MMEHTIVADRTINGGTPHVRLDQNTFDKKFDRAPFLVEHSLSGHPLFKIEALLALAKSLPSSSVEYNAGELPVDCDPAETPLTGLSPEETIRRIADCKSWMVLKNVEQDARYQDLLMSCLAEVRHYSSRIHDKMTNFQGFIFLSSPNSITPYHMDPEHNFLLQIQGRKFMTVFARDLVTSEELERFHAGAHRNLKFLETFIENSETFELTPGVGLHVPSTAPHFVRNGENVSISFSITFRTPDLERLGNIHLVNGALRARGLHPNAPGAIGLLDSFKDLAWRTYRKSAALVGRIVD